MTYAITATGWRAVPDDMRPSQLSPGETLVTEISDEILASMSSARAPQLIAARRFTAETAGITVGGMAIDTGRDSQALITGARLAGMDDPSYVCNWKTPEGFIQLNAETVRAVANAVRAHVQACFDREAALLTMVEDGSYTEAALDEGWP
ncbi:DUF4376 domain-containing protein [Pseudomonas massiliensis]|uniref:DUF4376 domain-containing protein n=1 Tax=Pseudomonas massiliensis TaxID=522492 RepID=UPI000693D8EB|nr:DUF4376 domain-containing protein [Pseudomonas massiliensis]